MRTEDARRKFAWQAARRNFAGHGVAIMKKFLMATLSIVALTSATPAADMPAKAPLYPPAPVSNWTGLYVGIDGGGARANYKHDFNISGHYNTAPGQTFDYNHSGGIIGGHIGYNWQINQFVIGLEGSIAKPWVYANEVRSPFFSASDRWSSKVSWIAAVTPRLGFAASNFLIYGKGGWAYAKAKDRVHDNSDFVDSGNLSRNGLTAGGGVEYMFMPNWIIGVV